MGPSHREKQLAQTAAFSMRVWNSPMPMVTEAARSASVGLSWSSTAMPLTSDTVLPVT